MVVMAELSTNAQLPSPGPSPAPQALTEAADGNLAVAGVPDRRASQLMNSDGLHKYSCVVCATRKIKCDRKDPCGNCLKANSQCIYRAPPPPRRRKKGATAQNTVLERLKRAEDMLATQQVGPGSINNMMCRLADIQLEKRGQLINRNDSTRYLDNSMWIWLNEELKGIRTDIEDELEDDDAIFADENPEAEDISGSMLFGASPKYVTLQEHHPPPVQIFQLWQLYLQNVHPIIKILHAPTAQQQIIEAAGHLDNVSRPLECLMFCIYYLVTISLSDDEAEQRFQENKPVMTARYRQAAQLALLRAEYLNSYSMNVLQAYVIYLIAFRTHAPPTAMWALSGVAVRMGHRMGLHRDGEALGLPIFDVEIRRRLWWEIIFFDSRTAQLSGTGGISLARGVEYRPPRNVNDSELFPGMKTPPVEHEGITEMLHAMVRAEIGNFLLSFPQKAGTLDGSWHGVAHSTVPMAEKDKLIDDLESRIERKFISKCDPLIPQHLLASTIARSAIATIRFMAHNPRHGVTADPKEEQLLFDCSCMMLENTVYIQTEPSLRRFAFYTRMHFQYLGLIYMLKFLKKYVADSRTERGWSIIHAVHELDPPVLKESAGSIYKAISGFLLSAWEAREAANTGLARPAYIEELFVIAGSRTSNAAVTNAGFAPNDPLQPQLFQQTSFSRPVDADALEFSTGLDARETFQQTSTSQAISNQYQSTSMDWGDWENLMEVGELSQGDFSSVGPDFFNTTQNAVGNIPPEFENWTSSGRFP